MTSQQKILLNVQTNNVDTAIEVSKRYPGRIVIGVTAKDFPDLRDGIAIVNRMQEKGVLVSVGLGDGAANQWQRALDLALATKPFHLNQVFPASALSRKALRDAGALTIVNGLIRPSSKVGAVCIGTGPESSNYALESVSTEFAIALLHEMSVESVKLFPLHGLTHIDELREVAMVATSRGMMVEPTGGLTVAMLPEILKACSFTGEEKIMPHLYSSVKNPTTGDLDLSLIADAMAIIDDHIRVSI
ncbi:MAG TPA: KDGP aldolase [Candidatus Paceibacterota bacterium]|nr:KDGP aldolase [Candidatus Paceibacterota bacterium]